MNKNKFYFSYIGLGILYVVVKIIFVSFGYLHLGAIIHGSIPTILTFLVCLFAIREKETNFKKLAWHWLMFIFPLLILIITPLYMYLREGSMWLMNGRLPVLIIYEITAIIQSTIAVIVIRQIKSRIKTQQP